MCKRPTCVIADCGRPAKGLGWKKNGTERIWSKLCTTCHRAKYQKNRKHLKHKKDICERCGFVPEHIVQLQVDHIDGNHTNNDPTNLQTLCCNCHVLKSLKSGDFRNLKYR